jgi:hypothetical protein
MVVADGAKTLGRRFHRVAPERAMDVEIDETGREIVPGEIHRGSSGAVTDISDLSVLDNNLEAIADFIRQDQAGV